MERALVVVDDSDVHRELLAEAGHLARGVGAELRLFTWVTPEDFERDAETLEAAGSAENTTFSDADSLDVARNFAREMGEEELGEDAPPFETLAAVTEEDDLADAILDAADGEDCDHVFIVGRRRSPTGKVLFGNVAQRVILNFEGPVTVTMD